MEDRVQTSDIHVAAFVELVTNTKAAIIGDSAYSDRSVFAFPPTPEINEAIVRYNTGEVAPAQAFGETIRRLRRRCFQQRDGGAR